MINKITVGMNLCEQLRNCKDEYEFFDSHFVGDRRYKIKCLSGYGNCSRDFYRCCVGDITFDLTVIRNAIWDNERCIGYVPTEFILSSNEFVTRHVYDWSH